MNLNVITVSILHIADMDAQMKHATTVQSVLAYIAKRSKNILKEDIIKCKIRL
jgi:hypothetical protein